MNDKTQERAAVIAALRYCASGESCEDCPLGLYVGVACAGFSDMLKKAANLLERDAEPPNDPLALEELREMDGEPVYLVAKHMVSRWDIVCVDYDHDYPIVYFRNTTNGRFQANGYGKTWLAYRRKPEGGGE